MEVGIGLPNAVQRVQGHELVEFARAADQAGFPTLGTIDRIAYDNYEPLVSLAAAAAVTERIKLMTSILLAPLRTNHALFAKQAASVNGLSGGRLVLGMAVGAREDDFTLSKVDFGSRGRAFDEQLEELDGLWNGDELGPEGRPTLIFGGSVDAAFARVARYGDGWIMSGGTPDMFRDAQPKLDRAWSDAGRDGEPRRMALAYYALGPQAEELADRNLKHYYAYLGDIAEQIALSAATSPDQVKQYVEGFSQAGCDELILFSAGTGADQVELLREALD